MIQLLSFDQYLLTGNPPRVDPEFWTSRHRTLAATFPEPTTLGPRFYLFVQ